MNETQQINFAKCATSATGMHDWTVDSDGKRRCVGCGTLDPRPTIEGAVMTETPLLHTAALLVLPEGTHIIDNLGRELVKDSSGRETANPAWIAWVDVEGDRIHARWVSLPATLKKGASA